MSPVKSLAAAAVLAAAVWAPSSAVAESSTYSCVTNEHFPSGKPTHDCTYRSTDGYVSTQSCGYDKNHEYNCSTVTGTEYDPSSLRFDREDEARKNAWHTAHPDPNSVNLCPPPHKMTARDGCQ